MIAWWETEHCIRRKMKNVLLVLSSQSTEASASTRQRTSLAEEVLKSEQRTGQLERRIKPGVYRRKHEGITSKELTHHTNHDDYI